MDKAHLQAQQTRRRNAELRRRQAERRAAEQQANIDVLSRIRDDPASSPEQKLEAVRLLFRPSSKTGDFLTPILTPYSIYDGLQYFTAKS